MVDDHRWALIGLVTVLQIICVTPFAFNYKSNRLRNQRQLTFNGANSEPTVNANGRYILFQGAGGCYGSSCEQVYRIDMKNPSKKPHRLSTGFGDTNTPVFAGDSDNADIVYAATFHRESLNISVDRRPTEPCPNICNSKRAKSDNTLKMLCSRSNALWELKPDFDVFRVNAWGNFRAQLTNNDGFDGEAAVSPDGRWIVYTSMSSGDPDLWLMNAIDGSQKQRLTTWIGYEGRAQFSPDNRQIIFHATRPLPGDEMTRYRALLKYNLVELRSLNMYVLNLDDFSVEPVVTDTLPGWNSTTNAWTPTFLPIDGRRRIVFSSNAGGNHSGHYRLFQLELGVPESIKQLTFHDYDFDAFPTVDRKGRHLVWASTAGEKSNDYINLFMADLTQIYGKTSEKKKIIQKKKSKRSRSDPFHFPGEKHLKNVRKLTFGGQNAEGYFSFDGKSIVMQAAGLERYGTQCDQIYRADFTPQWPTENTILQRLSTGLGACTCSYFFPDDQTSIHAATFGALNISTSNLTNTCPPKRCTTPSAKTDPVLKNLCNTSYTWDIFPDYDIYKVNQYGNIIQRLTDTPGYDAEGAVSPDGKRIVFTSMRTGDPELWIMDANGANLRQLTNVTGYDGGPFFSPDGTKVGFRASRPKTPKELEKYRKLLSYDLVEPLQMELYTVNVDGEPILRRVTSLGGSNWAPFYFVDNFHIVFSSNFNASAGEFGAFALYVIGEDGSGLEQVTFNPHGFDAFPMPSRDGAHLIWGSSRGGHSPTELNLYLADWINTKSTRK